MNWPASCSSGKLAHDVDAYLSAARQKLLALTSDQARVAERWLN
jgi:hypothetical protein